MKLFGFSNGRIHCHITVLAAALAGLQLVSSVSGQSTRPKLVIQTQSFHGVQRVVISTANGAPVKNDLVLQAVASLNDYRHTQASICKEAVIPAGKSSVAVEVPLLAPHNSWYRVNLHVELDRNGTYSSRDLMHTQLSSANNWQQIDHMLFVSSNITSIPERKFLTGKRGQSGYSTSGLSVKDPALLPAFSELNAYFSSTNGTNQGTITSDISFLQNLNEQFNSIHPGDFFENWTSLAGLDSIFISFNDLQLLAKTNKKLTALRFWLSTGGKLIVFDCGTNFEHQTDAFHLLRGNKSRENAKWQEPTEALIKESEYLGPQNFSNATRSGLPAMRLGVPQANATTRPMFRDTKDFTDQILLKTRFMRGEILAVADNMTKWKQKQWRVLLNTIHLSDANVEDTIGESNIAGSYLQGFRIPGIGQPPVIAFQILIVAFILTVGPAFYFLFNSSGRLYLLLVSTPILALSAVFALFGYGILSDGFSTRGRVHSVTLIDHSLDTAMTHARHAFYSGVTPGECVYDDNTYVCDTRMDLSPTTVYQFRGDSQKVIGGQIKARSPFQLASLRCFEPDQMLTFSRGENSASVSNGFDSLVKLVIVHTDKGWFIARNIETGSTASATKVNLEEAKSAVRELTYTDQLASVDRTRSQQRRNWMMNSSANGSWGYSNRFFSSLHRKFLDNSETNSYIAVLETSELVANPLPNANFGENELHVIVGKW